MSKSLTIDIGTKKLIIIALATQSAVFGLIGLDALGIEIPIVRPVVLLIYLLFIPGFLILRLLKIDKLNATRILLYCVGLSLSLLMFTGGLINLLYPFVGIPGPISEISLTLTIGAIVVLLSFVLYLRDKDYSTSFSIITKEVHSPLLFLLLLLPLISILGTFMVRFYDSNILLLALLFIIAIIPLGILLYKPPTSIYPVALFVIAISLLFHAALATPFIWGHDAQFEYYFANTVIIDSYWDPTIPHSHNAMLSITMLAPIFSILCGIDSVWTFKVIYQLIFSLVPLGLYEVYRRQVNDDRIAFLSSFFFMSMMLFIFSSQLHRQQIAGFFLVLLVLSMIDSKMDGTKKAALFSIFSAGMITSHYGVSYIFMFLLIFVLLLSLSLSWLRSKSLRSVVSLNSVFLYIVLAITWYMYVSSGVAFGAIVSIGNHILASLDYFLTKEASDALFWIMREMPSLSYQILRLLHFVTQFFIVIGLSSVVYQQILKPRKESQKPNFHDAYLLFSIICIVMLLFSIIIPHFTGLAAIDLMRLYHVLLFWLAPFCIIGALITGGILKKLINFARHNLSWEKREISWGGLAAFFAIFFLFSSSFVPEIANEYNSNLAIGKPRIAESGTIENRARLYATYIMEQEVFGAKWLSKHRDLTIEDIYTNPDHTFLISYGRMRPKGFGGEIMFRGIGKNTKIEEEAYVFLRYLNVAEGVIVTSFRPKFSWFNISEINPALQSRNKIYCNGGSTIFR
jgi:uncharacterized membrane protein